LPSASRALPATLITALNQAALWVLQQKDIQARLASEGAEPAGGTPAQFANI
jgi:hypothetical protein